MNDMVIESNVYYLPAPAVIEAEELVRDLEWPSLAVRLRNAWWRVRLAFAEVCGILGRPPRSLSDDVILLDDAFDAAPRPRRRPVGPAAILDFEAARLRLRPAVRN
jgi:hypothetical protein